jgi:hypothetical protein
MGQVQGLLLGVAWGEGMESYSALMVLRGPRTIHPAAYLVLGWIGSYGLLTSLSLRFGLTGHPVLVSEFY